METFFATFLASIAMASAPLIVAALGETISEKAGVVNLSLDGTLLLGAMTAFALGKNFDSIWIGIGGAITAGMAVGLVLSFIAIGLRQHQVAVGLALAFFCRDLAYFLGAPYSRQQGPQILAVPVPILSDIPLLGPIFFQQSVIVYCSYFLIPAVWFFFYKTPQGLILRAVGENPEGCWSRGIRPRLTQSFYAVLGSGLVGLAGAAYSLAVKPGWGRPQGCEGIGWIALALVIFGGWHPIRVAVGAYLFGFLQMLGIVFSDMFPSIPAQIFQVAPFPLMIFTLILIHISRDNPTLQHNALFNLLQGKPPRALGRSHYRN